MIKLWFRLRRPIVLLAILIIVPIPFLCRTLWDTDHFKLLGMLLQISGIITVILGIRQKTLKVKRRFIELFFPFLAKKSPPIVIEPAVLEVKGLEGRVKPVPPKSIEEVATFIENEIMWHRKSIEEDYRGGFKNIKGQIRDIHDSMNVNFNELYKLSGIGSRDIEIELIGAICLIYGTILATFPDWFIHTTNI